MVILLFDLERFFFMNGDSGVIVLIKFDKKYYGVGVIFGGYFDVWGVENKSI